MYTILLRSFVKNSRGNNSRVWNHKIYAKSWGLNKFAEEGIVELIPIERERIKGTEKGHNSWRKAERKGEDFELRA